MITAVVIIHFMAVANVVKFIVIDIFSMFIPNAYAHFETKCVHIIT